MHRAAGITIMLIGLGCFCFGQSDQGSIMRSQFGFVHKASGLKINFDTKIEAITKILGKPKIGTGILASREFVKYQWDGLEIFVLPASGDTIDIKITNTKYVTLGGISIGSRIKKVKRDYGEPASVLKKAIEYQYSNPSEAQYADGSEIWGLRFYVSGDIVSAIEIGRLD